VKLQVETGACGIIRKVIKLFLHQTKMPAGGLKIKFSGN
jgi:hypothetical protein